MRIHTRYIILTSVFLCITALLMTGVLAQVESFSITSTPIKNTIFKDEVAEFALEITNLNVQSDRLTIFTPDPQWRVYFDGNIVRLGPKETKKVTLLLTPTSTITAGAAYSVPITVQSSITSQTQDAKFVVTVDSDTMRQYQPSIFADVTVGDQNVADPTKPIDISIKLINRNPLNIEKLEVTLKSPLFEDSFMIQLGPNEQVTKIVSFTISQQTPPQRTYVNVEMKANGESIGQPKRFAFDIGQAAQEFKRTIIENEDSFLKKVYVVELTNIGNVESTETIQLESSFIQRWFTKSNFDPVYKKINGKYYAIFDVTLAPGAGVQLSVVNNYRPFVITALALIIAFIIGTLLYYTLRSAIIITKKVQVVSKEEGSTSRLKVTLNIKNRTSKLIENVKVIERTPTITEVDKEFVMGTLKPSKIISNSRKGTLIRWDFATLEPFEERIITYNINSKLSILGDIQLPPTIVKYNAFGHTRTVKEKSEENDDDSFESLE